MFGKRAMIVTSSWLFCETTESVPFQGRGQENRPVADCRVFSPGRKAWGPRRDAAAQCRLAGLMPFPVRPQREVSGCSSGWIPDTQPPAPEGGREGWGNTWLMLPEILMLLVWGRSWAWTLFETSQRSLICSQGEEPLEDQTPGWGLHRRSPEEAWVGRDRRSYRRLPGRNDIHVGTRRMSINNNGIKCLLAVRRYPRSSHPFLPTPPNPPVT